MADISRITDLSGATYNIKDITARQVIPYGEITSNSRTVMTATVPGVTKLVHGTACMIRNNGLAASNTNWTLNVNGLGAKPVYSNLAAATRETTLYTAASTFIFIYDEDRVSDGCWVLYRGYDSNTNTIGYQLRTNSTLMPVSDTARYYKLYFTSADGNSWVPASVNSTNNATTARAVNQRPINPFGRIVYTSASTNYTAGSNLAATTIWDQYVVTLGYSFNRTGEALVLTIGRPVYVKCAPQSNGSAIIDADVPYVQELPSTADGKIYIFLGVANAETTIELYPNHPVYYYSDGAVKMWTGAEVSAPSTHWNDIVNKPAYVVPVENIENPTQTTSTAASVINDALEYASLNGYDIVLLPPGEYLINETIYLQDNVILQGSGTAYTKLKIATGYNIDCIRVDHPVHDAGIKDLTIDGNKIDNYSYFHQSTEHGNAINVWLHRGIIENVRTEYVYKHALLMNYDVGSGTADGLGFDPEDEYRQGNLNKVMHCNFDNSTLEGVMWGWRTMDSWFCYNNVGSNGANLYLEGGTSRFIGNHFDGDGDDGVGPEYNVFCPNGCNTMLFEGNIFENAKKHNFYFQQPSYNADASYAIQIINNIVRTGSKAQDATYNLIEISGYSDSNKNHNIVISGNSLLNPNLNGNQTKYGIHLAYCDGVTLGSNTFYNIAQDNIKVESSCANVYIDGLPYVSSSDNGKVLMVVNGVWTAASLAQANGVSF